MRKTPLRRTGAQRRDVRRVALTAGIALVWGMAGGCVAELDGLSVAEAPELLALSSDALTIGAPLEFYGAKFVNAAKSRTAIRFKGRFLGANGEVHPVDYRLWPHWVDGNRLVWAQVGPFRNPFSDGEQIGTFDGTVSAINVLQNSEERASEPLPAVIRFQDSVTVRALAPLRAQCSEPARRLLGGFPYALEVEAVGFDPINFTYSVVGSRGAPRPRIFRRPATSRRGSLGLEGELVFDPVPDDEVFYLVSLTISALGTDGKERSTALVFAVHRPVEYVDSGTFRVAETFAPMPDSGCIAGGETVRHVTYTESATETRERQVGVNWKQEWSESDSTTKTLSHDVTKGIHVEQHASSTTEQTLGWSWGVGVSGKVSLFTVAEAGVTGSYGQNGSFSRAYTSGWSVGRDYSTSDTESWAFAKTRGHSVTKGGESFWKVSSSESKSLAFTADILPGQFGVFYRQTVRLSLPGALVAYSVCGEPKVVGETDFSDYNWSVDLGVGPTCNPYPKSRLPEAECFVAPCSGS